MITVAYRFLFKVLALRWMILLVLSMNIAEAKTAVSQRMLRDPSLFKVESAPSKPEWQLFMSSSDKWRRRLWKAQESRGKTLKDWSWGWRIGWLKVCTTQSDAGWCKNLLRQGLLDKALVVRAEAVATIGRRWWGTGNREMLSLLVEAYKNKKNYRGGKPLYIQKRILFAINGIGGQGSGLVAKRLAEATKETQTYWKKLSSVRM